MLSSIYNCTVFCTSNIKTERRLPIFTDTVGGPLPTVRNRILPYMKHLLWAFLLQSNRVKWHEPQFSRKLRRRGLQGNWDSFFQLRGPISHHRFAHHWKQGPGTRTNDLLWVMDLTVATNTNTSLLPVSCMTCFSFKHLMNRMHVYRWSIMYPILSRKNSEEEENIHIAEVSYVVYNITSEKSAE